jgi:hypothetical protein
MDGSREYDLRALKTRFEDATLPSHVRSRAYRKFQDILAQAKDRTLQELRYRLVLAHRNDDPEIASKLEEQIREYGQKKGYGRA